MTKYCKLNVEVFLVIESGNTFTPHLTKVQKVGNDGIPIPFVIGTYETELLEFIND